MEQRDTTNEEDGAEDEFMAMLREKEERDTRQSRISKNPALAPLAMTPVRSVRGSLAGTTNPDSPLDDDDSDREDDFSVLSGAAEVLEQSVSISRHSPSSSIRRHQEPSRIERDEDSLDVPRAVPI